MKIEGSHKISAPRERVFAALIDPAVLQKCIPGCEELERADAENGEENKFNAKLSAGVGSIKAMFTATVTMKDIISPSHYRLEVEGKGQPGFLKGAGDLNLEEQGAATEINYTGEVNVGGMLASVGQRMIQGAAAMMATRFFAALESEAAK
ncbi:MAG TPA: carbon monoxide dehydrogenase subunit G [Candidatus Angelobacter sp.]|nr:carbon monoxide dehydrogenase subunit G [Candidatus Angelobacter sp.]